MKRILSAGLVALSMSGCGIVNEIVDELNQLSRLNAGSVTATAYQLTDGVIEVKKLSGGIQGLAPGLGGQGGGVAFAPALSLAPATAATTWTCDNDLVGTVTNPKKDYLPAQEEAEADITLSFECTKNEQARILALSADVTYKDGSTGTTVVVEIDGDDASPSDLLNGWSRLTLKRYYPEPDKRAFASFEAELDMEGSFDDGNLWRYGKHVVEMRSGAKVTAEIIANTPVRDGEDFVDGTATRTVEHAEGEIKTTTESAEITGKDTGTYSLVNEYANGTKDEITVTADGQVVTLDAKGHNGFTRTGSLDLVSGDFELVTTFPAGMPITKVTETGTWQKNATSGEYNRKVEFADGRVAESQIRANVNGDTITATFTHEDNTADGDTSDKVDGSLVLTQSPFGTLVKFEISNAQGDKATLDGTKYADGSAVLHYTKDLKDTAANPDEEGTFSFNADGSGQGVITVKSDRGTATVTVTVNKDGQ